MQQTTKAINRSLDPNFPAMILVEILTVNKHRTTAMLLVYKRGCINMINTIKIQEVGG